jgi:hypothetical protein
MKLFAATRSKRKFNNTVSFDENGHLGQLTRKPVAGLRTQIVNDKGRYCTQLTGTGLRDFRLIIRASCHYQPITAILYTTRTGTVASVIQADSI